MIISHDENKAESIFLEPNVEKVVIENSDEIKSYFDRFLLLRKDVLKVLETLRNDKVIKSNIWKLKYLFL